MDVSTVGSIVSIVAVVGGFGGGIFAWGRLREQIVTEEECKKTRVVCQNSVCAKVDEVKKLVIQLHDKDNERIKFLDANMSDRIRTIDAKREVAKDSLHAELKELSQAIARIEGRLQK